jgi:hypothetical protein
VTAATFQIAALTLCRPSAELLAWAACAKIGERFVYAVGRVEPRSDPIWRLAGSLADARRVTLVRDRRGDGLIEFIAERIRETPRPVVIVQTDDDDDAVLRAIRRRLNLRLPMATNAELARECSLKDANRASYVLRRLIARGVIQIVEMGPKQRRIVTLMATRQKTVEGSL